MDQFDGLLVSLLYHVRSLVHHDFDRCWYSRVGRYLLQELLGHFHPKFNDQHWAPGVYGCAALICILWGYLVLQGNIGIIWPLFGVSNQLLGTMTLAVSTTVIMRLGRKRYAWVTGIPCIPNGHRCDCCRL